MAKAKRLLRTSEQANLIAAIYHLSREKTSNFEAKAMSEEIEMNEHLQLEPEPPGMLLYLGHIEIEQKPTPWATRQRCPELRRNERLYSHTFFGDMLNPGWIFVPADLDYFINYELQGQKAIQTSD